jgi:hypothetical protein
MAKQAGDFFIEGTIDELTYYKMYGRYYVRRKSSLTKKKFHKSKSFERSRESCQRFSEGNRLASRLYRRIKKEKREYSLFCFLKKRAILLLKEGKSLQDAEQILIDYLKEFGYRETEKKEVFHQPEKKNEEQETVIKAQSCQVLSSPKIYLCGSDGRTEVQREEDPANDFAGHERPSASVYEKDINQYESLVPISNALNDKLFGFSP